MKKTLKSYWKDETITIESITSEIKKHTILHSTASASTHQSQISYRFSSNIYFRDNGFPIYEIIIVYQISEICKKEIFLGQYEETRFIRNINFKDNCLDEWESKMFFHESGWTNTSKKPVLKNGEIFEFSILSEALQKAMNDITENWIMPFLLQKWVKNTENHYKTMFDMDILKKHELSFKDILTFQHLEIG